MYSCSSISKKALCKIFLKFWSISICLFIFVFIRSSCAWETHQCKKKIYCFSTVPRSQTKIHENALAQVHEDVLEIQIKIIDYDKMHETYNTI